MPVSFAPATTFTPAAPTRRQKTKPTRKRCKPDAEPVAIPDKVFSLLVDRLEAATAAGRITGDCRLYREILYALFPVEFHSGEIGTPSQAMPKSEQRILDYAARVARGEPLHHPRDVGVSEVDERIEIIARALCGRRAGAWPGRP
jgi:hypothetical protein